MPGLWQRCQEKDGWAHWVNCRLIHSIYWENVVIWKRESAALRQVFSLDSDPRNYTDWGGRMNGWLKRLNLVAVCQCQLCSEVEVVERICCRYFQTLTKVCKLPWAMWETNIRESNVKALNTIYERECFISSLNWLSDILLNTYFVPFSTGDFLEIYRERIWSIPEFPEYPSYLD